MKRSLIIAFLLLTLGLFAACGKKEEAEEVSEESVTLSDQVYFNIKKNLSAQAGEIIDASQRAVYSSYEEVYNDYSGMLADLYKAQESDLKQEIADGADNNALSASVADKTAKLRDIAADGVSMMSKMASINPVDNGDYSDWSAKLNNICTAYENKLTSTFTDAAK